MDYKLSKAAEGDLLNIALYGDENFGINASDEYRNKLILDSEVFEVYKSHRAKIRLFGGL